MPAENFLRDIRIGLRVLIKEKSFCALAVIVLALGICGVTTMFSVVNGVMLRGFSFPTADRLASANFIDLSSANFGGFNGQISSMDFDELLPQQKSFEVMAAYLNGSTVNVTDNGKPQRYTGAYVTDRFLTILGMAPMLGRDFAPADNAAGAEKVAIIGYGIWQRDFGGSPAVIGRGVRINGKPATIVGVMPKGFAFPQNEELWLPLYSEFPPKARNDPANISPSVIGLLNPGVSPDQATAEFTALARHFAEAYPETNKPFNTGQVEPLIKTFTPRQLRGTLYTMLGFCVGVLLIACVNVMNMQFARATLRAKELAIRSSLGATRVRLIRQMLTESLLIAGIGASVGIGLAYASTSWLQATIKSLENPPPAYITFDVDGLVLAVTVAATIAAAVLSGLLPAWMSSRANANAVLRDGGRGTTSRGVDPRVARAGRLSDRRHLRPADRIAAAGALDPQPADDRLRLRHRRHPVGAHGPDGRRLPHRRRAQAVLRSPAPPAGRQPGVRRGRLHQPLPDGVRRQRPDRDRRQESTRTRRIARSPTSSRSPAATSASPARSSSKAATSTRTISTRSCRSPSSTRRSRGNITATRARSGGGSGR